MQEEPLHDSFVLFTSLEKTYKRLTPEQGYELMMMIFEYSKTGEISEVEDPFVNGVFDIVAEQLRANWAKYEKGKERNRHNAIIGRLKEGQELSAESIEFLKSNGFMTEAYLKGKGVEDALIKKLLATASHG